jgi:phosphate:Na+ symporter
VLIGALVTAVIQSSSATVAITITLAQTGMITYDAAVALVLGENIGTTITAFLSSLGATTWAGAPLTPIFRSRFSLFCSCCRCS